jgi:arylformamidase
MLSTSSKTQWIDISLPLKPGMVHWPGDPPFEIQRVHDMGKGDGANLSRIVMGTHAGTHIDAPSHFISNGKGADHMPLEAAVGPARIIEIFDQESVELDEIRKHRIKQGERILFKTRNSAHPWDNDDFTEDFVFISEEAASYLAERKLRLIGVDYLSVGRFKSGGVTHRALLEAGVWIIEGLDLSRVPPGKYDLICLPLRIVGGDGAPCRAIVRPR